MASSMYLPIVGANFSTGNNYKHMGNGSFSKWTLIKAAAAAAASSSAPPNVDLSPLDSAISQVPFLFLLRGF